MRPDQRLREPLDLSPEYRDGLPMQPCRICGEPQFDGDLDDSGVCEDCGEPPVDRLAFLIRDAEALHEVGATIDMEDDLDE